jgi:hypothetical protein
MVAKLFTVKWRSFVDYENSEFKHSCDYAVRVCEVRDDLGMRRKCGLLHTTLTIKNEACCKLHKIFCQIFDILHRDKTIISEESSVLFKK